MDAHSDVGGGQGQEETDEPVTMSEEERFEAQRDEMMARLSQPVGEGDDTSVSGTTEAQFLSPEPERVAESQPPPPEPVPEPPKRKAARLKLSYKNPRSVVREYTDNLQKGGCFIKTAKPLAVGREVLIEVRVPSIADDPISIPGVVTWSSRDLDTLDAGQDPGMGIEYLIDAEVKADIKGRLQALV